MRVVAGPFFLVSTLVVAIVAIVVSVNAGTHKTVREYHYLETRGAALTDERGATLECENPYLSVQGNGTGTGGNGSAAALTTKGGVVLATASSDFGVGAEGAEKLQLFSG